MTRRTNGWAGWVSLFCLMCLVVSAHVAKAAQPEDLNKPDGFDQPVDWDVLPNGLIVVQYDRTGDGVPDHFRLHQVMWSGWTAQSVGEIEAQAQVDGQWVFIVEYDEDRYVYLTREDPLFVAEDPQQDGRWTAVPVESHDETPTVDMLPCPVCMR